MHECDALPGAVEKKQHYLKHEREQCATYSGLGIVLVLTGQNENLIVANH